MRWFSFSGDRYWPGVIYLQGKGSNTKLTWMIVGRLDRPMEVWRFQEPQAFQGGWISRLSRHARFRFPPLSGSVSPIPEKTEDYEVTGSQETPIAAVQSDIHSYLSRAMMVEEYLVGENGIQSHGFHYDPRRGDLEAQSRAATSH